MRRLVPLAARTRRAGTVAVGTLASISGTAGSPCCLQAAYRVRWMFLDVVSGLATQQTRYSNPLLVQCWASVVDGGPTLDQHWFDVSCLLGSESKTLIQCCFNVGPSFAAPGQLWPNIGSESGVGASWKDIQSLLSICKLYPTLTQYCFKVGPASLTVAQPWNNIATYLVKKYKYLPMLA